MGCTIHTWKVQIWRRLVTSNDRATEPANLNNYCLYLNNSSSIKDSSVKRRTVVYSQRQNVLFLVHFSSSHVGKPNGRGSNKRRGEASALFNLADLPATRPRKADFKRKNIKLLCLGFYLFFVLNS